MAKRKKQNENTSLTRINSYKLFYHRHYLNLEIEHLAAIADIPVEQLRQLEHGINCPTSGPTQLSHFPEIQPKELAKLETALKCSGKLAAGSPDDFATSFIAYRAQYFNTPH
jgi:hypothetical protein